MTIGRAVVAVSLVAVVTAWVVASGGAPPPQPATPETRRIDAGASAALDVLSHANRLHERLAAMPPRPGGVRNPFRFVSPHRAPVHRSDGTRMTDPTAGNEAAVAPPPRPELRLIGIAEDGQGEATERTAVVTGLNQVYLVREGEQIAMRFLVKRIGADAIEIEDLADSTPVRLGLR